MSHHQQHAGGLQNRMYETRHGLDVETRRSIAILLNQRLADATDLYSQTKHAHWNVKGMNFYQLHKLFDELAEIVEGHIDTIAERITALGGTACGTTRLAAASTSLPEFPADLRTDVAYVEALVERYALVARKVGEGIDRADEAGDKVTSDMLTEVAADLDKALYFLESHLQNA